MRELSKIDEKYHGKFTKLVDSFDDCIRLFRLLDDEKIFVIEEKIIEKCGKTSWKSFFEVKATFQIENWPLRITTHNDHSETYTALSESF